MDFELLKETPEMAEFRQEVRQWLAQQIPQGMKFKGGWTRSSDEEYLFRRELARKLGAKGWFFPIYPKEYGGGGLTVDQHIIIETELERYGLHLSQVFHTVVGIVAPPILIWGTEEQKRTLLPPMLRGETVVWQLLTEPQGGSDVATCRVTAIRGGDEYVVNGEKTLVGDAHPVDYLYTLVCTDPSGPRHQNLSWLLIPANLPGITIQPFELVRATKCSVFFDDVRVPAFYLVGGENNGWKVAATHMELEHGGAGTLVRDPVVERLVEYCKQTEFNGRPLLKDRGVRDLLADFLIESDILRLFGLRDFWLRYSRRPHSYEGAQSLYYYRVSTSRNAHRAQQILGYSSLVEDPSASEDESIENLVRRGATAFHGRGTLDMDRVVIARRMGLGRLAKEEAPATLA